MKNIDEIIAQNILKRAEELGFSQKKLAKLANIEAPNLNQIIKLKRRAGRKTLQSLGRVLDLAVEDFYRDQASVEDSEDLLGSIVRMLSTFNYNELNRALGILEPIYNERSRDTRRRSSK